MTCPNCTCHDCARPDILEECRAALPGSWRLLDSTAYLSSQYPGPELTVRYHGPQWYAATYRDRTGPAPEHTHVDTRAESAERAISRAREVAVAAGMPWGWGEINGGNK